MSQINHNVSLPNDGLGDELRAAFVNQNTMNTELYTNKVEKVTGKDLSSNNFSDTDKAKLDALAAGAEVNVQSDWEQNDDTADDYIKNKPAELFSSVGSFHYVDLTTQTTPLTVVADVEKLITNDTADTSTNVLNAPYGISSMWDTVNNQLDFTQTAVGDLVTVIPAIEVTTTIANQNVNIYIKLGIGSSNPTTKQVFNSPIKAIGSVIINPTSDFVIDTLDIKDYPAEIFILSDDDATVKSGALDIKVVRKDINVLNLPTSIRQDINFGAVATNAMDSINNALPNILIQDQNLGQIKIQGTFIGVYHEYLFTGIKGYYGNGALQCTDDDLLELGGGSGGGGTETTATMGALINSAGNATPNDTDLIATAESAGLLKKITWTNAKAFLKTYYDTVYTTTGAVASQITTALSGYLTSSAAASIYEPIKGTDDNYVTDAEKALIAEKFIYAVTETGTSFSLADSHNGKITILTASCTVTIPNGLIAGFEHTIVTLAGVTLTVALGGSVTLFNNAGTTMAEKLSCTIKNRTATNQYITAGSL